MKILWQQNNIGLTISISRKPYNGSRSNSLQIYWLWFNVWIWHVLKNRHNIMAYCGRMKGFSVPVMSWFINTGTKNKITVKKLIYPHPMETCQHEFYFMWRNYISRCIRFIHLAPESLCSIYSHPAIFH